MLKEFVRAGPREKIVVDPTTGKICVGRQAHAQPLTASLAPPAAPLAVKAAIVTCGGLCPGLNTVIRELVMCLHYNYGVDTIYGVEGGYRGFKKPLKELTPGDVVVRRGCSRLLRSASSPSPRPTRPGLAPQRCVPRVRYRYPCAPRDSLLRLAQAAPSWAAPAAALTWTQFWTAFAATACTSCTSSGGTAPTEARARSCAAWRRPGSPSPSPWCPRPSTMTFRWSASRSALTRPSARCGRPGVAYSLCMALLIRFCPRARPSAPSCRRGWRRARRPTASGSSS